VLGQLPAAHAAGGGFSSTGGDVRVADGGNHSVAWIKQAIIRSASRAAS
jgi:hypothetical protein